MSSRGQATPRRTAASIEPSQGSGMPVPSPKKIRSNMPRSAMRARSSNNPTSGYWGLAHEVGWRHAVLLLGQETAEREGGTPDARAGSRVPPSWKKKKPGERGIRVLGGSLNWLIVTAAVPRG